MTIDLIRGFVKYSELIAAIVGTIFFYKYKNTPLKYFLYLLWYITLTEFLGRYIRETGNLAYIDDNGLPYNLWLYNTLEFITFNTLFFIYSKYLESINYKKWVRYFAYVFSIVFTINWIFIQNYFKEGAEIPVILGSIFLILSILFYLIELLRSEIIIVFHRLLLFWISVGLLLFYTGTIPFTLKVNEYMLFPGIHKLFLIVYILAIIMYLTFSFGFIWSKKE